MAAILVSAKVSVFYSKIKKTFPKSSHVGWNPIASIFHVWSGSYGESQRTRRRTQGRNMGRTREIMKPT